MTREEMAIYAILVISNEKKETKNEKYFIIFRIKSLCSKKIPIRFFSWSKD